MEVEERHKGTSVWLRKTPPDLVDSEDKERCQKPRNVGASNARKGRK